MVDERIAIWVSLSAAKGVGAKTLAKLAITMRARGIDAAELGQATAADLRDLGLSEKQAAAAQASLDELRPSDPGVRHLLVPGDPMYPAHRLSDSPALPVLLRAKGQLSALGDPAVGFSGSRNASPSVLEFVQQLASTLAANAITIVSGNARGVDACAHQSAVDAGTSTVAVLAEGLSSFAPSWKMNDDTNWLAVSQFADGAAWQSHHAMSRNETIAALSDAVVVACAGDSGGSLAMGRLCLKTGRPLAVPDIDDDSCPGNRLLLEEGATALPFADIGTAAGIVQSLMNGQTASGNAAVQQETLFD